MKNLLYIDNRHDWREWLEKNHRDKKEIWLVYFKKHTGKKRIPYNDAVEEALCFGWIDSIIKRLDDEKYAQKFTPRKDNSIWSESNKRRVKNLLAQNKMEEAGLKKVNIAKATGKWDQSIKFPDTDNLHPYFKKELDNNKRAKENFKRLSNSYKKQYIGWISSAKKEITLEKRIKEAIKLLEKNKKLGMK